MSQQGLLQQSIRDITGTELDFNGDWLALMASDSITTGSFNERLLAWINVTLGTSYTNLPEAQQAFAVDQGYSNWSSMGAIVLAISLAATLAEGETQALALDFTDDFFQADTGHYGSAFVLDTSTPANDYDSHPYGLLTYTSPSKMTLGPSGTLRFGAHNLYVNSASPANQSITVVSGATYSVDITGSVSVTASGAATGTWTAGSNTFTAATTTLTLGSTSGSGTVVCRRTPSDSTYLATGGAARYALPYEWDSAGNNLGILVEEARTNLCLYSDDLTNAAWTKSNMTTAKTATGADGVANSATTCTATAGNATVLQSITSGSAARVQSCWIKRRTGTGNIDMTQDNGTTWATVTVTSSWTRVSIAAATVTNPIVGLRIVTSGDAVDVMLMQQEVGSFVTSSIPTLASTVTRAADDISIATSLFPASATEGTFFVEWRKPTAMQSTDWLLSFGDGGDSAERMFLYEDVTWRVVDGNVTQAQFDIGATAANTAHKAAVVYKANDFAGVLDGGSVGTDASGTIPTLSKLWIGQSLGNNQLDGHLRKLMYLPRRMSNADMQTLTSA